MDRIDGGRLIVTQQIRPTGGIGKSKRRTNLVFSLVETGTFIYQPLLYLISSFLASSFSLRGKCDQKAMVSLSRKASAVSS